MFIEKKLMIAIGVLALVIIFVAVTILSNSPVLPSSSAKLSDINDISFSFGDPYSNYPTDVTAYDSSLGSPILHGYLLIDSNIGQTQNGYHPQIVVYDSVNSGVLLTSGDYPQTLTSGSNKISLNPIKISNLNGNIQLQICWGFVKSYSEKINQYSDGVQCVDKIFSYPKISFSVVPSTVQFSVSKSDTSDISNPPRQNIQITNTGNVVATVGVYLPSYFSEFESYPKNNPQFPSFGFGVSEPIYATLSPGESALYDISVSTGNVGEFDTPVGTYNTNGFVYLTSTLGSGGTVNDALVKQPFSIVTTVTS